MTDVEGAGTTQIKRGWIYNLKKDQITSLMQLLSIESEGTLDEHRKKLSAFITTQPERFKNVEGLIGNIGGEPSTTRARETEQTDTRRLIQLPSPTPSEASDTGRTVDQIRKWGCHFDGRDPVTFLERIEELQICYGLNSRDMLTGLPELLRNEALLWYRNHRNEWTEWNDFVQAFRDTYLPRRYRAQLLRELQNQQQGEHEPYAKYATQVLTLMRRAGRIGREEQLEQLYEGLRPEYKLYIRRNDIGTTIELNTRAQEYEAIEEARRKQARPVAAPNVLSTAATTYNRDECCWRCKQRGHTRANCQRPPKKFCSQCGKDGVLTRDCHPHTGNSERVRATRPAPEPAQQSA